MGITVRSKNYSIDLGCTGFLRLRTKVAELTAPDIFLHYRRLLDGRSLLHEADRKKFYEEYDKKTEELDRKHNGEMSDILDFLYESDCSGEMDVKHCHSIYEVIKDYDDNICYGYDGQRDCATFKDFKRLVMDCIDTGTIMKWW